MIKSVHNNVKPRYLFLGFKNYDEYIGYSDESDVHTASL